MPSLFYVADPMCSWCWGFAPVLAEVEAGLPAEVELHYVMGGLAPDSDEPMPAQTRDYVQGAWRQVEATTGVCFNWDYWDRCKPRRSTYPACRAVLAAGLQGAKVQMFAALQRAYYQQARNPSETSTHIELAGELGLDQARFATDLVSAAVEELLREDFVRRRQLAVREFPSMLVEEEGRKYWVMRGWAPLDEVQQRLDQLLGKG